MYRFNVLLVFFLAITSCYGQKKENPVGSDSNARIVFESFGKEIDQANALESDVMYKKFQNLVQSDTLSTKFNAKVLDVCKARGCWMRLELENGEEAMVKFKDYGFFVPMDITGREVIVNGKAFVGEMSVADQKHYAKDGGQSDNEIAKITQPKKTYGFLADGVLLKK